MTVLLDAFAVVVLLICFVSGLRKGFAKTFFTLLGSIGGLVAAIVYNDRLSVIVNARFITPMFRESTTKYLLSLSPSIDMDNLLKTMPSIFTEYLGKMGVTADTVKTALNAAPTLEAGRDAAIDAIFAALASTVSACISFALIFFGVLLACAIVGWIVGAAFKLPVLKQFNRLAGGIAGLVKASIVLVVLAFIFNTIQPALKNENVIFFNTAEMSQTHIFKYFVIYHPAVSDSVKEEPTI